MSSWDLGPGIWETTFGPEGSPGTNDVTVRIFAKNANKLNHIYHISTPKLIIITNLYTQQKGTLAPSMSLRFHYFLTEP